MHKSFKLRIVQLDLARQMETTGFIKRFIDFIAGNGYNTLALYLEGRIKTPAFQFMPDDESYTQAEMREIVSYASARDIDVIPVISTLGHAELFLKCPELAALAENREEGTGRFGSDSKHVFCPSLNATYQFLEKYLSEISEIFPSSYFHAGCDESWDIGCCGICRNRLQNGETCAGIFAQHLLESHRIITKKLGKRMIIWDDMFEYYPQALEMLPRNVILACWQYHDNVEKTTGHFNNRTVTDSLAHYDRLGFDYLICPADYTLHNVESFTAYGTKHHPLGGWMTTWEKSESFMLQSMPLIAYAGQVWSDLANDDYDLVLQDVVNGIFGIGDELFFQAVKAVCSRGLYLERRTGMDAFLTRQENNVDYSRMRLADVLLTVLPGYLENVKASSRDILEEIVLSLRSERISYELDNLLPQFFNRGSDIQKLTGMLNSIIVRIEAVGRARVEMWKRIRPGIVPCKMAEGYEYYLKSMSEVSATAEKCGYLKIHFMLPDQYSAQTVRVFIKYAGEDAWEKIGQGVFKESAVADCFYNKLFMIDKVKAPEALKIETLRYGGQGFTYFEAENSQGRFVPAEVRNITGKVSEPENLLSHDWRWSFAGERDTLKAFLNPELAEVIHGFEIVFKKEE
ncbi:MAG: family 20 glycosylhydrolase [Victivallaceae bacterium]